jgi:hypothetical protein
MIYIPGIEQLCENRETWEHICDLAENKQVDSPLLLDFQSNSASAGRWDAVYAISLLAGLETSVLIDADDEVFIDWGTSGRVPLKPPVGARMPFKTWVHTHPGFAAYWSATDTNSLAIGSGILRQAIVLGAPGPKVAINLAFNKDYDASSTINASGPLSSWSDEPVTPWDEWYQQIIENSEVIA